MQMRSSKWTERQRYDVGRKEQLWMGGGGGYRTVKGGENRVRG